MSLLDALLFEGHRDSRDAYVSLRGDGALGSGRMDDPWDRSTAGDFCPGHFGRIWRQDWLVAENNVVELGLRTLWPEDPNSGYAVGFLFVVGGYPSQYVLRQALIRDNLIRHVHNGSDPTGNPRAIAVGGLFGAEHCLIQRNLIRLDNVGSAGPVFPIGYFSSGVNTVDNTSSAGELIPAVQTLPFAAKAPEVITAVRTGLEEALVASFLK